MIHEGLYDRDPISGSPVYKAQLCRVRRDDTTPAAMAGKTCQDD